MSKNLIALSALVFLTACATTTESPVSNDFQNSLLFSGVDVTFAEDREVPGVYDKAVQSLLDSDETGVLNKTDFMTYMDSRGGAGEEGDQLGERYLEYRIADEVASRLRANLVGTTPVDIRVNIERVITPNAATMMLLGEVKGIEYDLDVMDAGEDTILLDFKKPSNPFVERSSGGFGGVLGVALRAGSDTNLNDLEQMVEAVAEEITQILTGTEVNKTVAKKIRRAAPAE